jgi:hypothetical protein
MFPKYMVCLRNISVDTLHKEIPRMIMMMMMKIIIIIIKSTQELAIYAP